MTWSAQQDQALKAVSDWLADPDAPQVFRLFGFAGTGKTTIARSLKEDDDRYVLYGAFTGKAALVMRSKGCTGASTIHSMIYNVEESEDGSPPKFVLKEDSDIDGCDLVVIDECSMVDEVLGKDLLSFGKRVLVIGDPAQLPPVKGAGFFTEAKPDFMLTEVHRQALDNPIIRLSMTVREGGRIDYGDFGTVRVVRRGEFSGNEVVSADQVLVGLNRTRHAYNHRIRELRGYAQSHWPQEGERLICLRNNRFKRLYNGGMWNVVSCSRRPTKKGVLNLKVLRENAGETTEPLRVEVRPEFFLGTDEDLGWEAKRGTDEFTFGYAITTHKSQGSQWDNVFLFDESKAFRDDAARWLYTGITRAAERITIVRGAAA